MRTPGAAAFFVAAALGRVGVAMTGLGLVWLLHARTGGYATAGLAAGAFALAEALGGPQVARLIDRFGQTRVLPLCLLAHGGAIAGVLVATTAAGQIGAAAGAGAVVPQLGVLAGARWARLLRGSRAGELATAFSLESLANAGAFLLGPVLVTSLGAAGATTPATALAATLVLGGGAALAVQRRTAPPAHRASVHKGRFRPDFRLAAANLALGGYFGTLPVAVASFAAAHATPAAPIVAAGSVSGLLSGWAYGLRRPAAPPTRQLVRATGCLAGAALLLPFAPSACWLAAALVVTEAAIPPTLVLLNVLTEQSADPRHLTQAFTWNNSTSAAGSATAAWLAGRTADAAGASAALALAPAAGLALLVLAGRLNRTARPRAGRPSRRGSTGCRGRARPGRRRARPPRSSRRW
ncbi:MFS transporter [Amycolatopsis rhabdoformis]|uniref:MFS transporter n=1 Tax=Amycolatopsis rhabdoformis TaxID=1448059 RepID=A0ABZ1IGM8_9PSEU|nr:MFS transporter [Amycolatopsis rhabdoformis]WSE32823.1 MFS transporter [Amycolatopsis rhabdoformis]